MGTNPHCPHMDHRAWEVGIFSHYKIIAYQSNYYYILQLDFIYFFIIVIQRRYVQKQNLIHTPNLFLPGIILYLNTYLVLIISICITDSFFLHFRKSLVALNQRRMPSFSTRILACVWLINWGKKIFGSLNEKLMRAPALLGILV